MNNKLSLIWTLWLALAGAAVATEPALPNTSGIDPVMKVVTVANVAGKLTAPASTDDFPPDTLKTCLASAADFSPVYPTTRFPLRERVVASFRLGNAGGPTKLTCKWMALEGSGFATVRRELASSDLTVPRGADRGSFSFLPHDLKPGRYLLDVSADGKPWKSAEFNLIEPPKAGMSDPTTLFPLRSGVVRGYTMLVHPGPGGFANSAFVANPDGTFWTRFIEVAEGADANGVHLSHVLIGNTAQLAGADEWYLWGPKGLALTRQGSGTSATPCEPPEARIQTPIRGPATWSYHSEDGVVRKTFRLWGPVPLKGLNGEAPGYVVLEEQSLSDKEIAGGGKQSIERHYLPGEGLVRSIRALYSRKGDWCRVDTVLREVVAIAGHASAPATPQGPMLAAGTPGIELRLGTWAPPLDPDYGWWGIVKAGDKPDKPIAKSNSQFKLNVPAGTYDVYWVQDYLTRERPLLLASRLEVKEGNLTILPVDSGIQLAVAPWVPPRDTDYGLCAVVRSGDPPDKWLTETRTGDRFLVPPGSYDIYWVQDYNTRERPMRLAAKVEVKAGQHAEVPINTGITLNIAPWVPKRDGDYGWFSIVPSGAQPDKWANGTRLGDRLLCPAGVYDAYWVQDYATRERPLLLAGRLEVKAGDKATVNATAGIRLKVPAGTPPLNADYGWWGAVPSGSRGDQWANMVKGKYDVPILLPPGAYDLFCRRDYEDQPHCIAAAIDVQAGRLIEAAANPLNTVPQPKVALVLPGQSLVTCLAPAADMSPVHPTTELVAPINQLFAVFQVGQKGAINKIACTWSELNGGDPQAMRVLATSTLDITAAISHGYFRYAQPEPLRPGCYRVALAADGRPWQSADFTVGESPRATPLVKPENLLPLSKGVEWSYTFTLEGGPGHHVEIPGITPDAQGVLRGALARTVADVAEAGARIEDRLNGNLVSQEWWRLDPNGLFLTQQQQTGGEPQLADPPEPILPLPLRSYGTWQYASRDGTAKRLCTTWGPVQIPFGSRLEPGYIVLAQETLPYSEGGSQALRTVERDFVPGLGLVRQLEIDGARGITLTRTELVLQSTSPGTPTASARH